jgi:uncharacterized protein YcbX
VVLARDARLATLDTVFDATTGKLTIAAPDGPRETFDLANAEGREAASAFLAKALDLPSEEVPTLFSAGPHRFTDVSVVSPRMMNAISLISRDSVDAFGAKIGHAVDERRFRGNIVFSGLPPLAELDWEGREISIGKALLRGVLRTKRCAATEVGPETGQRDLRIPRLLHDTYGHMDMGCYVEVIRGGRVEPGDAVIPA